MRSLNLSIVTVLTLVLFLFSARPGIADTLVSANDIQYHSDFEEQVFNDIISNKDVNILALYLCGDADVTEQEFNIINSDFFSLIEEYKTKRYQRLKDQKRVSKIYTGLHETLLDKYSEEKSFSAIFEQGTFQCVTSSMLFSIVFDELNIPYEIKLLPTHTYLIAYPETHYILLETTEPQSGTLVFDERFKSDYVEYIRKHKLIGKTEYENGNTNELFDAYYLKPETIDQIQLAGAQYYNLSLVAMSNRNFVEGYNLMEKAYLLQPSAKNSFMLLFALTNAIDEISITEPSYAEYLGKLMKFQNNGLTSDQLFDMFSNLTSRQLLFDGNTELYEASYNKIISNIQDSLLFSDIKFLYNFERGRVMYLNGEFEAAEQFIGEAFLLKPKSADAKAMFYGIMLAKMEEIKQGEEAYSLTKFQDYFSTITDYKNRFIHLNEMKGFRQAWLFFCLGLMDQFYQFEDDVNGEKYRQIFETEYPNPIADFSGINKGISNAYATAAVFYKQSKNLEKSLEITNKGLEYIPDNTALQEIKTQVN